jgi:hypothetical protein
MIEEALRLADWLEVGTILANQRAAAKILRTLAASAKRPPAQFDHLLRDFEVALIDWSERGDGYQAVLEAKNALRAYGAASAEKAEPVVIAGEVWHSSEDELPVHGELVLCEMEDDEEGPEISFGLLIEQWNEAKPVANAKRWIRINRMPESLAEHAQLDALAFAHPPAAQVPAIPAGWKLVPVESTEEMLRAVIDSWLSQEVDAARAVLTEEYRAMLAAAPAATVKAQERPA